MPEVIGHIWSVEWLNPETEPPNGLQRIQIGREQRRCRPIHPEVLAKYEELGGPGTGWFVSWAPVHSIGRQLSENQKRKLRRTKLYNRMKKQHPLFAEQFYEEKLREKPAYYGVTGRKTLPRP